MRSTRPWPALAAVCAGALIACASPRKLPTPAPAPPSAELVLRGARVLTVDPDRPVAEAVAVSGDRIVAVGSVEAIAPFVGPQTRILELEGAVVVPGFIEGHGHLLYLGEASEQLDLTGARSWDAVVARVAEAVAEAEPGTWIRGWGWHQDKWDPPLVDGRDGFPVHTALSAASPDNPVALSHASGHATFANAAALRLAGVGPQTAVPEGGEIVRDEAGQPTGLLRESAASLVWDAIERTDARTEARMRRQIQAATDRCLSEGVTSFHDAGVDLEQADLYRAMAEAGELRIRLWVMLHDSLERLTEGAASRRVVGAGKHFLTVNAVKVGLDGALGSRGAWLLEPYADRPDTSGGRLVSPADFRGFAELARDQGMQMGVHAIGDRANREVLDVYRDVLGPGSRDRRWRIEHAQHLHPDDLPRFAAQGIIAAIQGTHCTSDGPWVPDRLGTERAREGAYMWRALVDSGAVVVNGSDAPVEDVSPIEGFYATVTREMADGERFFPEQRLTREEALKSYTIDAAFAAFEEDLKGSIEVGKLADLTVLDRDILTVPEEAIRETRVLYTIIGGQVAYAAER